MAKVAIYDFSCKTFHSRGGIGGGYLIVVVELVMAILILRLTAQLNMCRREQ